MIDASALLSDLKRMLTRLEDDLRARCEESEEIDGSLRGRWREARDAERTGQVYEVWRDEQLTQVGAAWVLGCVFVRFLEDNKLIDEPRISGPGERRKRALEAHTLYFREHRTDSDRDYLLHVFREVAALPAASEVFDEKHNPLWTLGPSGDAAGELLGLFQHVDPDSGDLVHDFTDPAWGTRFLGDLYQDLSAAARKRYALLQTPEFVEEFILDRTLDPAIEEFGLRDVTLIDPACGSGHFLLGAFHRLFERWRVVEPGTPARELVRRALDQVAGVDLNPFAVAITRFRLLVAAMAAAEVGQLRQAPGFSLNVTSGDSLLHGPRPGGKGVLTQYLDPALNPLRDVYETEDPEALRRILGRRYHAVVGNPPYITPKDAAVNMAYRKRFGSCHRKYSLAVPFTERFFDLALPQGQGTGDPAGFVGMITANSFMKREFGKKLVETFIRRWDLTHIIDMSGAYVPGHGTPTVILFARHRDPVEPTVRTVMGIRGEPAAPEDAARGLVWTSILAQIERPGSEGDFVGVDDIPRERFHKHPWSLGGGGAAELKVTLERGNPQVLGASVVSIGFGAILGEDDAFAVSARQMATCWDLRAPARPLVEGDQVRDWNLGSRTAVLFPYSEDITLLAERDVGHVLWISRSVLKGRRDFSKRTYAECGRPYWEYHQIPVERNRTALSIAFAEVATHNHFILDRGGKVFKQSAPVIKLPPEASEDEHLGLLGLLNCSTACFWTKQVCHSKGGGGIGGGLASEAWEKFFVLNSTKVLAFPLADVFPIELAQRIDSLACQLGSLLPKGHPSGSSLTQAGLRKAREVADAVRARMRALQEELDWECYRLYGLLKEDLCAPEAVVPGLELGERAFEIVLARKVACGVSATRWFERHGSTPLTEIPDHWPAEYRALIARRIETIEKSCNISLIEQPEYKRRWMTEAWKEQQVRYLRSWLLERLEDVRFWPELHMVSAAGLADRVRTDQEFLQVAALYRDNVDFDLTTLVTELVGAEGVPHLPVLRYKSPGLRKRALWERTWDLQRQEDAIDARTRLPSSDPDHVSAEEARRTKAREVGDIPVPPKYPTLFTDPQNAPYLCLKGMPFRAIFGVTGQ